MLDCPMILPDCSLIASSRPSRGRRRCSAPPAAPSSGLWRACEGTVTPPPCRRVRPQVLFPPLTYLKPTGKVEELEFGERKIIVKEVVPHLGSL